MYGHLLPVNEFLANMRPGNFVHRAINPDNTLSNCLTVVGGERAERFRHLCKFRSACPMQNILEPCTCYPEQGIVTFIEKTELPEYASDWIGLRITEVKDTFCIAVQVYTTDVSAYLEYRRTLAQVYTMPESLMVPFPDIPIDARMWNHPFRSGLDNSEWIHQILASELLPAIPMPMERERL